MAIRKVAIESNDEIYECFLGVIGTRSGKLICIYGEADSTGARDFSQLVLRERFDDCRTRSNRRLLAESHRSVTNVTTGITISDIRLVESARNLLTSTSLVLASRTPSGEQA